MGQLVVGQIPVSPLQGANNSVETLHSASGLIRPPGRLDYTRRLHTLSIHLHTHKQVLLACLYVPWIYTCNKNCSDTVLHHSDELQHPITNRFLIMGCIWLTGETQTCEWLLVRLSDCMSAINWSTSWSKPRPLHSLSSRLSRPAETKGQWPLTFYLYIL